jgi:acetyl-CoA C-acetyltransferase
MPAAYIIAGCRTPIGKFLGGLSSLAAPQLGAIVIAEALRRADVGADRVEEVILGNVLQAGLGQAPARQAALAAGLPPSVPAVTINKMCGSGLKAVMMADQVIRAGDANIVVAGGIENMSQAPYIVPGARAGLKFGHTKLVDSMLHDGLWCGIENLAMGDEANYIAASKGVSRADQDAFAVESHRRALAAATAGWFDDEIVPVGIKWVAGAEYATSRQRLGARGLDPSHPEVREDEGPRRETTLERLARLPPAFDPAGTVTAGNASQLSDGAAAVVVVSEGVAAGVRSPIKARIVAAAATGVPPKEIFIAPVSAIEKVLAKAKLTLADIDLVELNEAFAAQCLACMRPLGLDPAKTNIHGGAIALGHPIGASGARVLVTLLYALSRLNLRRGLAALCLGGGNAVAVIVERVS